MQIEVVHACPRQQHLLTVELAAGATVREAIRASGILDLVPELGTGDHLEDALLGIFGEACTVDTVLRPGDRVEIHRPLQIDPKEARRRRA